VNDRHDDQFESPNPKVESVRKSPHRRPSDVAVNDWLARRMLGEKWKRRENFVEEFVT
jgi:hypothetical protein